MRRKIETKLDKHTGVLYVIKSGGNAKFSRELREDPELIVSFNSDGDVVGAILLSASEMTWDEWMLNPGRNKFPSDLLKVIDNWFSKNRTVH